MEKKYWFKAKRYGLGWVPCSWQGWAVILAYAGVMLWWGVNLEKKSQDVDWAIELGGPLILALVTLLTIAWRTGEPLKWRWNGKAKGEGETENQNEDTYQTFK